MNILLVAPYPDLVQTAKESLKDFDYHVETVLGDLDQAVQVVEERNLTSGADVIISRGGTAKLLQNTYSIPVFEIDVTGYDLLRAIYPHTTQNKKIAFIGYENVIRGAKNISSILDKELGYFLVSNHLDIEPTIKAAQDFGADVIIGDAVSVQTARDFGIEAELIKSGPEAILIAVTAATRFYQHVQNEMLRNRRLNIIMEHSGESILYLNSDHVVEMSNTKMLKVLQKPRTQVVGHSITSEAIPQELSEAIINNLQNKLITISEKDYMVEIRKIATEDAHAATLVFLQSSGRIKDLEDNFIKELTRRGLVASHTFDELIAKNPAFVKMIEKAKRYSETNSTILLLGETGSGKEMFAQSIHNASLRKDGPFVAINCAALPDSLLESELFGYSDGAFTGAKKGGKVGLFEMAHKGTIFLDEVNDMSKSVQSRLLRVIQEKQVMRIGDDRVHAVDVRFIAASNKDLYEEVESGKFRRDLYYRLRVLDIEIPPLRERQEDIVPLFTSFIQYFCNKYGYGSQTFSQHFMLAIQSYPWPGNVRQLRNFAEKTSVQLSMNIDSEEIENDLIEELIVGHSFSDEQAVVSKAAEIKPLKDVISEVIQELLEENNGNISKTAQQLKIDRATVRKYAV